ncbi:MAG: hypothetical protein KDA85_01610, partial [Planctomycetaceae bacterium]|nr:hypothetical protein [Planctomycetaceae bacterium]
MHVKRRRFSSLIVACLLLVGCGSSQNEHEIKRIPLADGAVSVRYVEIIGPAAYAPHTIRFYFVATNGEQLLAETEWRNDGANPGAGNVTTNVHHEEIVEVTLTGQEQDDEHWMIERLDGAVKAT